jgi:hypothetical protein
MSCLKNKFYEVLEELIDEIKNLGLTKDIINSETDCNDENQINKYFDNCNLLGKDFYEKNAIIFNTDNSILENINLHTLWNCDVSEKTREQIWKYLFTLYLYSYCSNKNINMGELVKKFKGIDFNELNSDDLTIYSVLDNLNSYKRINKLIKNESKKLDNKKSSNPILDNLGNLGNLGNLNLTDGLINGEIGKLAKEIAGEINPEKFQKDLENKDPQELLNSLFTGNLDNSSPIMGLVNTISGKIQEKITEGSINENILFNEAQDILGNCNKPGNINKTNLNNRKNRVKNKIKQKQKSYN